MRQGESGTILNPLPEKGTFAGEALAAFAYPLSVRGLMMLVPASAVFAITHYVLGLREAYDYGFSRASAVLLIVAAATAAYVATYLFSVIRWSAGGEWRMPDWPFIETDRVEALVTFLWGLAALAISFAPLMIYRYVVYSHGTEPVRAIVFALRALGCLYLPMSLLAVVLLRSPWGLSPHVVIPTMLRVPFAAGIAGAMLWCAWTGGLAAGDSILSHMSESNPFVAQVAARMGMFAVGLYLLFIVARIIGVTYWLYQDRIGWFGERVEG